MLEGFLAAVSCGLGDPDRATLENRHHQHEPSPVVISQLGQSSNSTGGTLGAPTSSETRFAGSWTRARSRIRP